MAQSQQLPLPEDEIDLRELVQTLWDQKILISALTLLFGLAGWVYTQVATPVYEASATIEIGYTVDENDRKNLLGDSPSLARELNIVFIDLPKKTQKNRTVWVEQVGETKGNKSFVDITVRGLSYQELAPEIKRVLTYTQKKQQETIADFLRQKRNQLEGLNKKLAAYGSEAQQLQARIAQTDAAARQAGRNDSALAAIAMIEKRGLEDRLAAMRIEQIDLELEQAKLQQIVGQKADSKDDSIYLQKTALLGDIIGNNQPVSPKKKLIVAVALVAGLMGSIFLVFFIEFIKGFKKQD